MKISLLIFILLVFSFHSHSSQIVDSINQLIPKSSGFKKGNLHLELANHFLLTHPDSSIFHALRGREIGKQLNNSELVIRSFSIAGEAYQKQNNINKAVASYFSGISIAEQKNEKSLLGTLYNGVATCYFSLNNLKKCEYYLKLAVKAKKEAKDYKYYSIILANLASIQLMQESYENSIATLLEAEKTLISNKQTVYLSSIYNSLGAAFQMYTPTSDSCVYYFTKSLESAKKNNDNLLMMISNQNLGDYYFQKKNYTKALEFMQRAIHINDQRTEDHFKSASYDRISILYDSIGDYKSALKYKKMQFETDQRLFSLTNQKEIEELEIKYQSEKKEKEIQQQKQQIQKSNNQRNFIIYIAIFTIVILTFLAYIILQKRRIKQEFELQKLKLFENIFHEIRTPVTLIDGPLQVMKAKSSPEDEEHLFLIERNSKKLINLVNELLDASKLGNGKFRIHYDIGNIFDYLKSIIDDFSHEVKSKNIELIFESNKTEKNYSFPSNVVEKIMTNLIGNCLKYCPPNSKIKVNCSIDDESLFLKISDNGKGISKAEQKKIFSRFYRGSGDYSTISGNGIGLSIVKELVEKIKGKLTFSSTEKGTTFSIIIPIKAINIISETEKMDLTENLPALLLVEDDDDMALFIRSFLEDTFSVIRVNNGNEAINQLKEFLPDIVLSDVMMPQKDGILLLQEIKSNELTNHLPVALFSAKTSLESRLKVLQYGADAYISKPFSPDELKLTIHNLYSTIQRNQNEFKKGLKSDKTFEERLKSDNSYINKVIHLTIQNIEKPEYSVNELANDLAISRSQLHRKIVTLTGFSTTTFIRIIRLEKAKDLLKSNEGNVTEIAYKCGFNSQSYFTKTFTDYFGKAPSEFM